MSYRTYESLLMTGRAAKVIRRWHAGLKQQLFFLALQTAGDGGEARTFYLPFGHRKQATRAGAEFIRAVRKAIVDGKINTDTQYNGVVKLFLKAASERGKVVETAEVVADMPPKGESANG